MKTIVIYKSASGFTQKLAERIADKLHAECMTISAAKPINLSDYDTIIYGGAVHAQRIIGLKKIKPRLLQLDKQQIAVFAVGSADSFSIPIIKKRNLSPSEQQRMEFFYFRGGYNKNALSWSSRIIMAIVSTIVFKNMQKKKPEFVEILEMMKNGGDFTQTEDITPLLNYASKGDPHAPRSCHA